MAQLAVHSEVIMLIMRYKWLFKKKKVQSSKQEI